MAGDWHSRGALRPHRGGVWEFKLLSTFEKPGRSEVFAHTSPVYFSLDGRPVIVPEAVQDLIQKTDLLIRHTELVEGFREEADREETLGVYREARDLLRQRLLDDRE